MGAHGAPRRRGAGRRGPRERRRWGRGRRPRIKTLQVTDVSRVLLALLVALVGTQAASAQTYHSGQNLQPVFEGWEQNPDGSFNMVFGYLNRTYEEQLNIPIGADNYFEPGEADQGQPAFFYTRRQRFVFRVRVPADWGDRELVWTVTAHGLTDRAVGWLVPEQIIDEQVVAMNRSGGGAPDEANDPPSITLIEGDARSVAVGEPLTLTAVIADDGVPERRAGAPSCVDTIPRSRNGDL